MKRDINVVFEGSIPENYDRYLGPVLFEPFADDIVARLKKRNLRVFLSSLADREFSRVDFGISSRRLGLSRLISIRE
jgi:hypothetical protein